jgi:KDO2-lipid IV(A) lauroyltransferase
MVESLKMMTISKEEMMRRCTFKGTALLDEAIEKGQSCGLYLGHYCNWEWVTSLPLFLKSNAVCGEIYHVLENADFDRLFKHMRERFGSICIPMAETLRVITKYKQQGQPVIIGYIADQKPLWRNIHLWVDFLNHTTPVFTGSERLIRHGRQAFFYGDVRRVKRGFYECEFRLIDRHPEAMEENELTRIYMRELEKSIRRDPSLWLWSHNRWSRTKEEFDLRFEVRDGKVYEKINEVQYAQMQAEERRKKKKEADA